jgi:HD-GYP domain-containing protein (c-di-GMP phosphodiesterase class II)
VAATNPPHALDVRGVPALLVHAVHDPSDAYRWALQLGQQVVHRRQRLLRPHPWFTDPMANAPLTEVRRVEILAMLSLATDLGMALPFEHGLRSTLIAIRLADRLTLDPVDRIRVFDVCLLYYLGCTANAADESDLFGDEIAMHRRVAPVAFGTPVQIARASLPLLGGNRSLPRRLGLYTRMPSVMRRMREGSRAHCEVGELIGARLGLAGDAQADFRYLYESWRGNGFPGHAKGDQIPLPVRVAQVARDADVQHGLGGVDRAAAVVGSRAGRMFDPDVASAFVAEAGSLLRDVDSESAWDAVVAADPDPVTLSGPALDQAMETVADFVDLKSPGARRHSRTVAALAADAADRLGLDRNQLYWAGLAHDLGRVAVSAGVWTKPGPLSSAQREEVRLHPYYTERILARLSLPGLAGCAAAHHERLDGSGYHRAVRGADLSAPARVLAAADVYAAMADDRPYRPRFASSAIAEAIRNQATAGVLDPASAAAVLEAAGHVRPKVTRPAGLSDREVEVLALLSTGLATKQIAARLGIAAKTADRHIQNIYAKIGVSTRAAAALVAMQHGLVAGAPGWGELPIEPPADSS